MNREELIERGDRLVERGADGLRELSVKAAARGGIAADLAEPLREDAAFLRKLKPSLVAARARGEPVTDEPAEADVAAPTASQPARPPKPPGAGPNPLAVVGAALVLGIVLAKLIDWRSHAHPRG